MLRALTAVALLASAAAAATQDWGRNCFAVKTDDDDVQSSRPVDRYSASWAQPITADIPHALQLNVPEFPAGPFVGNGDVSLIYTGNGTAAVKKHSAASADWLQWIYMSKNDMWGGDSVMLVLLLVLMLFLQRARRTPRCTLSRRRYSDTCSSRC